MVLGIAVADGLDYLVVRERDGRYARYPYSGICRVLDGIAGAVMVGLGARLALERR